jgi:predicted AAA+ superfamily ATPase
VFTGDLDVDTIIASLSLLFPKSKLVPNKTLLFFDEIQSCPQALTALKFFAIDGRFDVIASGSLLGIAYKQVSSWPVGYVETIELSGLDFEEYLWACGYDESGVQTIRTAMQTHMALPTATHERFNNLLKEYIVIGGMPEVVQEFVRQHDFGMALKRQREIVANYADDIAKYAVTADKIKAKACFLSIPTQLAKENKKFQYKTFDSAGNSRKYESSLNWLLDAGMIRIGHNLACLDEPLAAYQKVEAFKVYMSDTGLLVSMLDEGTAAKIINGELGIYKGAIYENIIADVFGKANRPLYYYEKDSRLEIDFVIMTEHGVTAVEVKSSDNTKAKSLKTILAEHSYVFGYKLSTKNLAFSERIHQVPLYMAPFLESLS